MLSIDLELLFLFLVFAAIIFFTYINRKPKVYYSGKYEENLKQLGIDIKREPSCATAVVVTVDGSHFYNPEEEIPYTFKSFAKIAN